MEWSGCYVYAMEYIKKMIIREIPEKRIWNRLEQGKRVRRVMQCIRSDKIESKE